FFLLFLRPPTSTLFPYPTLFRSRYELFADLGEQPGQKQHDADAFACPIDLVLPFVVLQPEQLAHLLPFLERHAPSDHDDTDAGEDRKSTRLNSSHRTISYAVFCL